MEQGKNRLRTCFQNINFGVMKATGNGQQTQSERLLLSDILPMQESGQLNFIKRRRRLSQQSELGFGIFFADGHTDKQMIPHIQYKGKTIVLWRIYCNGHIPIPYVWDMIQDR
jgi:hypothetical protein